MKRKALVTIIVAVLIVLQTSIVALASISDPNTGDIKEVDNSTTLNENAGTGRIVTNNGIVLNNNGTVGTNNGEVVANNKKILKNDSGGIVDNNSGTIDNNLGLIRENADNGKISNNKSIVNINKGEVIKNYSVGTVKENDATITENYGIVEINGITGNVVISDDGGIVKDNRGTVTNAKVEDGKLVYDSSGDTYWGVTYMDGPRELRNYSVKEDADAKIVVMSGVSKAGYNFIKWTVTTPSGEQAICYYGGEEIDLDNPMLFNAIYEMLESVPLSVGSNVMWTPIPTAVGSQSSPVTDGTWSFKDGKIQYKVNGETLKNATAWITYVPKGQTEPVTARFYFDKNGNMATGWHQIDSEWYYFNTAEGGMYGAMLTNTTTPDGYTVDANGKWVKPL